MPHLLQLPNAGCARQRVRPRPGPLPATTSPLLLLQVFVVRATKEVIRDYEEFLKRTKACWGLGGWHWQPATA